MDNLVYIVTNTDNEILSILASNSSNFSSYTFEFVQVWAVAFSGNFLLSPGQVLDGNVAVSDECYDISDNFVLVDFESTYWWRFIIRRW
ncbi:MAG: hypothetical protein R2795_25300 [Saprospiraceae bacterium]